MTNEITLDELLAELEPLAESCPDGYMTIREWSDRLNVSVEKTRRIMHSAFSAGRLEVGVRKASAFNGHTLSQKVYRIKPLAKPKKKK